MEKKRNTKTDQKTKEKTYNHFGYQMNAEEYAIVSTHRDLLLIECAEKNMVVAVDLTSCEGEGDDCSPVFNGASDDFMPAIHVFINKFSIYLENGKWRRKGNKKNETNYNQ